MRRHFQPDEVAWMIAGTAPFLFLLYPIGKCLLTLAHVL